MLGEPKNGWVNISIGSFEGRGSYLDDIAINFLNAFISSYTYGLPAYVEVDEEGSSFTIISNHVRTIILVFRDRDCSENFFIDRTTLSKELICDIESNLEGWVNWFSYLDSTEKELNKRKRELKKKICILKKLIKNHEKR